MFKKNEQIRGNSINLSNQQLVAEWLRRLHRQGFVQTLSSSSLAEPSSDEAELAVEVQEFLPEEEIVVVDGGSISVDNSGKGIHHCIVSWGST